MRHAPLLACLAVLSVPVAAQVVAMDQQQLTESLTAGDPCCVIDGRSETSRRKMPLADALVYRPDLDIRPTAAAVVLADTDEEALAIARAIGRKHPGRTIIAVRGGLQAWKGASAAAARATFVPGGMSRNFVIPKNTCEQGAPLQELPRGRGK